MPWSEFSIVPSYPHYPHAADGCPPPISLRNQLRTHLNRLWIWTGYGHGTGGAAACKRRNTPPTISPRNQASQREFWGLGANKIRSNGYGEQGICQSDGQGNTPNIGIFLRPLPRYSVKGRDMSPCGVVSGEVLRQPLEAVHLSRHKCPADQ